MAEIQDVLIPEWDYLLVEPETSGEVVQRNGAAWIERPTTRAGEELVVRPATSSEGGQSRTGKILRAGPDVPLRYRPGLRVVYGVHAGTRLRDEVARREYLLLPRSETMGLFDGGETGEALGLSWIDHLIAPSNKLVVERLDTPFWRGRVLVPDGVRTATRANECVILAVGEGVTRFERGEYIYLAGVAPRMIPFGQREERKLYVMDPRAVGGRIIVDDLAASDPIYAETSPLRGALDLPSTAGERRLDEGDQRLPQ